jgi:isopentenyl phosphate kinase
MQQAAGDSSNQDITGGMRNKLYQQHLLAQLGVESEVLSFERFENVDLSLKGYKHYGTVFLPG